MTSVNPEYTTIPDLSQLEEKKADPTWRDYFHAFLLKFNTPTFRTLAIVSCGFTPAFEFGVVESLYLHAWYLLPPLSYTKEVGSYFGI